MKSQVKTVLCAVCVTALWVGWTLASPVYFVQIGSGMFGDGAFRTVFRLNNESGEVGQGGMSFNASDGSAMVPRVETVWAGQEGTWTLEENQATFTIPAASTLKLILQPADEVQIGWVSVDCPADISIQTLMQVAEGLDASAPVQHFENHVVREIENHAVRSSKTFVLPLYLFRGFQELNTAFAVVNLSGTTATAELEMRPGNVETVTLQPGEILADYFDHFWEFAVPEIFPLRLHATAAVTADAPLGIALFRTRQGFPMSGVSVLEGTEETEGEKKEAGLDTEIRLQVGETVVIQDEGLEVQFWAVSEDSRCPVDVVCIWEGQVRIALKVGETGAESEDVEVTGRAGHGGLAKAGFGDYQIELVGVQPDPVSTVPRQPSDYVITLKVTRLDGG